MTSWQQRWNRNRILNYLGLLIAGLVLLGMFAVTQAANGRSMVVFTANWCANCREVVPIVQEISRQNNISLQVIDVDSPGAPKQAKQIGVDIPTKALPQVYVLSEGRVQMIFDGGSYSYGQSDAVRARILQRLQQGQ